MYSLDRAPGEPEGQPCFIADSGPVSPTNTVPKQKETDHWPVPKTPGWSGSACYWKFLIPATGTTARFQCRLGPGTVQQQQRQLVLAWRGESAPGQRELDGIDKTRVVRALVG